VTEAPTTPDTDEVGTKDPEEVTAPDTEITVTEPAETDPAETEEQPGTQAGTAAPSDDNGCGAVITVGTAFITILCMGALAIVRKKNED
jgi:hypothetical protein